MQSNDHTRGTDSTGRLDRRSYLKATGVAATVGVVGLAGCTTGSAETGFISTAVSDQPSGNVGGGPIAIDEFDSCEVTLEGLWLSPRSSLEGDSPPTNGTNTTQVGTQQQQNDTNDSVEEPPTADEESGRTYYEFDSPITVDLVNLQGDAQSFVDEDREAPEGEYQYLQLNVAGVEGTVNGESVNVDTPGNAPLQFNEPFEIRSGWRTSFTADMAPIKTGNQNRYIITPVPREITVTYTQIESGNGNQTNDTNTTQ